MKAKVYFSREITPEKVVALYRAVGRELPGKVAVKLHSGEQGNQNFLGPDFWRPMIEAVHGTVVECNTAYEGERNTTEKHRRTMIKHGWSTNFDVDILDAEGPDLELAVPNGRSIQKNFVGKDIANYDSMLVLSHFKGHPMGGFGGAIKNISIGIASSAGKAWIHSAGKTRDRSEVWENLFTQTIIFYPLENFMNLIDIVPAGIDAERYRWNHIFDINQILSNNVVSAATIS